ncbi:2-hydroxy-3-keto-5-methylthiopentenyl-1-phosphate phosphatase-like protein [Westerdykella ornata]|uniref:2-hydroxy-3-keto-5-methylthiopentenyl-1-phosphate phosphatase-like protein n=1 Tax=Westerdykella ornata TaxID=318751 RepID=A0A6A6JRY0_WESOR|nr:2-hydroxy-3-keto-5-methylthiopentenyl-1-phosphate phosphatase-like protein [Westerdykella ornata]KAF2279024.1 2-hydroxy-3-keto-5-methylthiopentenyl-1-phosphate phosphatase-like protein [Westerdykella ornata]
MGSQAGSDLPAMKTNPKFIFFSDFDGTITLQDSNDFMTDNIGYGRDKRRQGNLDTLTGKITFRDSFREMMDSIKKPYNECIDYLVSNIKLDPGFKAFFEWSMQHNIPVVVLSSGMEPIIQALLRALVGPDAEKIQVLGNFVRARPGKRIDEEGGWEIEFRNPESGFGHDKSIELRKYSSLPEEIRPTMFYAGDGVSDLSAARETDLLFAKKGHDLITYCVKENVPFTVFEHWGDILDKCKEIVEGRITVKQAAQDGFEAYKAGEAGLAPVGDAGQPTVK